MPTTSLDTRSVHAGREDLRALGVHVPPIDLSSTNPLPDVENGGRAYEALATGGRPTPGDSLVYQRLWNPTVDRFEQAVAALEETEEAVAFATGMAALTATLLASVTAGKRHVVAVRPLYGGTDHVLATGLLGTEVTWATPATVASSIRPETGLIVLETPANPTLDLVDIGAVVAAAGPVPVLVDNTFATPVLQNPARHGATLVLHSATKFMGGHGEHRRLGPPAAPGACAHRRPAASAGRLRPPPGAADPSGAGTSSPAGRREDRLVARGAPRGRDGLLPRAR